LYQVAPAGGICPSRWGAWKMKGWSGGKGEFRDPRRRWTAPLTEGGYAACVRGSGKLAERASEGNPSRAGRETVPARGDAHPNPNPLALEIYGLPSLRERKCNPFGEKRTPAGPRRGGRSDTRDVRCSPITVTPATWTTPPPSLTTRLDVRCTRTEPPRPQIAHHALACKTPRICGKRFFPTKNRAFLSAARKPRLVTCVRRERPRVCPRASCRFRSR
jgi:hypothetical protein